VLRRRHGLIQVPTGPGTIDGHNVNVSQAEGKKSGAGGGCELAISLIYTEERTAP